MGAEFCLELALWDNFNIKNSLLKDQPKFKKKKKEQNSIEPKTFGLSVFWYDIPVGFWDACQQPWLLLDFPMAYSRTTTDLQMFPQDRVMAKAHFNSSYCCSQGQRPVLMWPLAATLPQISPTSQQVNGSPCEFLFGDRGFFFPPVVGIQKIRLHGNRWVNPCSEWGIPPPRSKGGILCGMLQGRVKK